MIKTILVSTDGSAHAQTAIDLGADLAAKYDARLVLLHVGFRGGDVPRELEAKAASEFVAAEQAGRPTSEHPRWSRRHQILEYLGRMILREGQERAESRGARRVEPVLEFGETAERILHHARHLPADLVVMGSRGYSELQGLFLGSVSHKVLHLAPCPCVTVRQTGAGAGFEGVQRILVPTDGSDHAARAIDFASDLAARYGAGLTLLHVMLRNAGLAKLREVVDLDQLSDATGKQLDPKGAASRLAAFLTPEISDEALNEIGKQILARGRAAAERKGVASPDLVLGDGDPAQRILEAAHDAQADLIAMGTRGLGEVEGMLLGSVSYKVSHTAPCSCMLVR